MSSARSVSRAVAVSAALWLTGCGESPTGAVEAQDSLRQLLGNVPAEADVLAYEGEASLGRELWLVLSPKPLTASEKATHGSFPARVVLDVAAQVGAPEDRATRLKGSEGRLSEWESPTGRVRLREVEIEGGVLTVVERLGTG